MNPPVLTAEDVLAWHEKTAHNWRKLLTGHAELLAVPCDIAGGKTVGELMQHIVAVELRYAERLANLPISDYAAVPYDSVESIYATHERASAVFKELLASDIDWDGPIEFVTRSYGTHRTSRKAMFFHALLHSERHYAQLATLARHNGVTPDWPMDYIFMHMQPV